MLAVVVDFEGETKCTGCEAGDGQWAVLSGTFPRSSGDAGVLQRGADGAIGECHAASGRGEPGKDRYFHER
ncbi:UNVERIFIED_CONTAM: hypothetical protein GTU68_003673 [Idotea baltica]|nr:hypothetical protein [Idotea baltica]